MADFLTLLNLAESDSQLPGESEADAVVTSVVETLRTLASVPSTSDSQDAVKQAKGTVNTLDYFLRTANLAAVLRDAQFLVHLGALNAAMQSLMVAITKWITNLDKSWDEPKENYAMDIGTCGEPVSPVSYGASSKQTKKHKAIMDEILRYDKEARISFNRITELVRTKK